MNARQRGLSLGPGDMRGRDRAWEDIFPPEPTAEDHSFIEAQHGALIIKAKSF